MTKRLPAPVPACGTKKHRRSMDTQTLVRLLDLTGIAVFALSGAS